MEDWQRGLCGDCYFTCMPDDLRKLWFVFWNRKKVVPRCEIKSEGLLSRLLLKCMKWLQIAILHTDVFVRSAQQKSVLIKSFIAFRCFHTKCIQLPLFLQSSQQDSVLGVNLWANHLYVHISEYHRQRIIPRGLSGGGGDGGVFTGENVCQPEITVCKPDNCRIFFRKILDILQ